MTAKAIQPSAILAPILRYGYCLAFYLALPILLLRLGWRARQSPGYGARWWQRFGFAPSFQQPVIWLHAASVGEVAAAVPLVTLLKQQHPDYQIVVTTTTATGAQRLQQLLAGQVNHCYVPYDCPDALLRFLRRIKPRLMVIMETELWPNLLHYARRQNIPILLANARLSERSARGYRWLGALMPAMLANITLIAAQTAADAARFLNLGADPTRVVVWGNLKFDIRLPTDLIPHGLALRQKLGTDRPIWIAASTHAGEEEMVLQAHKQIQQVSPRCLLILVPRHPERFEPVARLCEQQGLHLVRRSVTTNDWLTSEVFLGDTLGELLLFYAASDVAFVGGSLVPQGGHNLLEPAAVGVPIITGPHLFNFKAIAELFLTNHAAVQITDATQLAQTALCWLTDKTQRELFIQRARTIIQQNQGVLQRYDEWLQQTVQSNQLL